MALFTDGPINGTIQIQDYENSVLDVTQNENIDLDAKIRLAQDEIGNELMLFLIRRQPLLDPLYFTTASLRRRMGLTDVAVTPPLQQWHAQKTLALVFRDAYNNQLNDRYQGKWTQYEQLAKASGRTLLQIGVGLVGGPIAKAQIPTLTPTPGTAAGGTYYVAATWTSDNGQEGAPSDAGQIIAAGGQLVNVSLAGPPENATAWNVYAGSTPDWLLLQNTDPIPVGQSWTMAGTLEAGRAEGTGQVPSVYVVDQRVIERG